MGGCDINFKGGNVGGGVTWWGRLAGKGELIGQAESKTTEAGCVFEDRAVTNCMDLCANIAETGFKGAFIATKGIDFKGDGGVNGVRGGGVRQGGIKELMDGGRSW